MNISHTKLSFPQHIIEALQKTKMQICITGASGWIGMALLEMLENALGKSFDERVVAFASRARLVTLRSGKIVELQALSTLPQIVQPGWLLCHLAFLGKDKVAEMSLADYVEANNQIRSHIDNAIHVAQLSAIFYASSGAVYNAERKLIRDPSISPYGAMKVHDEEHFIAYGKKIVIPRVFNISGPYINKWRAYALSDLIMQGINEKSMRINAKHRVIRSYIHVQDVLTAVFDALLFSEKKVTHFDTAGNEDIELYELAATINRVVFEDKLPIIRNGFDSSLKADYYIGGVGITAVKTLDEQIGETADYLMNSKDLF